MVDLPLMRAVMMWLSSVLVLFCKIGETGAWPIVTRCPLGVGFGVVLVVVGVQTGETSQGKLDDACCCWQLEG